MENQYLFESTRSSDKQWTFEEACQMGYAEDGGMILPSWVPNLSKSKIEEWKDLSFEELSYEILSLYISDDVIPSDDLKRLLADTFSNFAIDEVVKMHPLFEDKNEKNKVYVMELYHGPTLAFKDLGLQFIGSLFEYLLTKTGNELNILVATSGDTGSAAIECINDKKNMNIYVLFPKGKISDLQEKQMTTTDSDNVTVIGIDGTSDDADVVLRALFRDEEFSNEYGLCSINSTNISRILMQLVHYFYAYLQVFQDCDDVSVSVPSGGFGNGVACYITKQMGLPLKHMIVAVNDNDSLDKFFTQGTLVGFPPVKSTIAPAMDIAVPYNIERLLYLIHDKDGKRIEELMQEMNMDGTNEVSEEDSSITISEEKIIELSKFFKSYSVSQDEIKNTIQNVYEKHNYLVDPHTSIGVKASLQYYNESSDDQTDTSTVILSTASYMKFFDVMEPIVGKINLSDKILSILEKDSNYIHYSINDKQQWSTILKEHIQTKVQK